jgi:microcystin-dependent protein
MPDPYLGEIRLVSYSYAPLGWLDCNGQIVNISDYDALYNLIGTTYGGDGVQNFALPDLRSRAPVHMGSVYPLGNMAGAEAVSLVAPELPKHTHTIAAMSAEGTTPAPTGATFARSPQEPYADSPSAAFGSNMVTTTGSSLPHNNLMPYLTLRYIIATYGIFPSQ